MANMSYCRFENTSIDLEDCLHHMKEDDVTYREEKARKKLIDLCVEIAIDYGHVINREVEEA